MTYCRGYGELSIPLVSDFSPQHRLLHFPFKAEFAQPFHGVGQGRRISVPLPDGDLPPIRPDPASVEGIRQSFHAPDGCILCRAFRSLSPVFRPNSYPLPPALRRQDRHTMPQNHSCGRQIGPADAVREGTDPSVSLGRVTARQYGVFLRGRRKLLG